MAHRRRGRTRRRAEWVPPTWSAGASSSRNVLIANRIPYLMHATIQKGFPWHEMRILRACAGSTSAAFAEARGVPPCHDEGLVSLQSTVCGRHIHLEW
jgi:hypothetical protein